MNNLEHFTVGNRLHKVVNGNKQNNVYSIISEVDVDNGYIYVVQVGSFANGDVIGDYGLGGAILEGLGTIATTVNYAGAASGRIQDIRAAGLNEIYLTNVLEHLLIEMVFAVLEIIDLLFSKERL